MLVAIALLELTHGIVARIGGGGVRKCGSADSLVRRQVLGALERRVVYSATLAAQGANVLSYALFRAHF